MKLNCHVILILSFSSNFDNVFDSAAELGMCEVIESKTDSNSQWPGKVGNNNSHNSSFLRS